MAQNQKVLYSEELFKPLRKLNRTYGGFGQSNQLRFCNALVQKDIVFRCNIPIHVNCVVPTLDAKTPHVKVTLNTETHCMTRQTAVRYLIQLLFRSEFFSGVKLASDFPKELLLACQLFRATTEWINEVAFRRLEESAWKDVREALINGIYAHHLEHLLVNGKRKSRDIETPERESKRVRYTHNDEQVFVVLPHREASDRPQSVDSDILIHDVFYRMVERAMRTFHHPDECAVLPQVAYAFVLSVVKQDFDTQTLSRPLVSEFLQQNPKLVDGLFQIARRIRSVLEGTPHSGDVPLLDNAVKRVSVIRTLESGIHSRSHRYAFKVFRFWPVPIDYFLNAMDKKFFFGGPAQTLRKFLHGKTRSEYTVYVLPDEISTATAAVLAEKFFKQAGLDWHQHMFFARFLEPVIVARPEHMYAFRLLLLTQTFICGRLPPISIWRVLMHALVSRPPETCLQLHDVALWCTMRCIAQQCVARPGHAVSPIGHANFPCYRFLPHFWESQTSHETEIPALWDLTAKFLLNRRGYSGTHNAVGKIRDFMESSLRPENERRNYRKHIIQANFDRRRYSTPTTFNEVQFGSGRAQGLRLFPMFLWMYELPRLRWEAKIWWKTITPISPVGKVKLKLGASVLPASPDTAVLSEEEFCRDFAEITNPELAYHDFISRSHFFPIARHTPLDRDGVCNLPEEVLTVQNIDSVASNFAHNKFLELAFYMLSGHEPSVALVPEIRALLRASTIRKVGFYYEGVQHFDDCILLPAGKDESEELLGDNRLLEMLYSHGIECGGDPFDPYQTLVESHSGRAELETMWQTV